MGEKSFSLEQVSDKEPDYRVKILRIINDLEIAARVVDPDELFHRELHEQKYLDARKEIAEFEPARRDVCESFGIPFDADHIYIFDKDSNATTAPKTQRAMRAFFIIVDVVHKEGFYGEGRTDHNTLFVNLADKVGKKIPGLDYDAICNNLDATPKVFIVFKGFLSAQSFEEISAKSRETLETPLHDSEGNIIKTAENWFLTGHSLD